MSYFIKDKNNGIWKDLPNELFIIGDIHGDFYVLKQALIKTGCVIFDDTNAHKIIKHEGDNINVLDGCDFYYVNKNISWNKEKKNRYIVFVGDLIDRCRLVNNSVCTTTVNDENCDYKILKLLLDLDDLARTYDSRVIIVLGNHEIMNIQDNFKYVSVKGINDYSRKKNIETLISDNVSRLYGIVRIQNYLICHGGINPEYIEENQSYYKNDKEFTEYYNIYIKKFMLNPKKSEYHTIINQSNGPLWDRKNGLDNIALNYDQCDKIFNKNLLNIDPSVLGKLKIVVAHCPQILNSNPQGINITDCSSIKNKIWRVDISMSRAFDNYKTDKIIILLLLQQLSDYIDDKNNEPNILDFYEERDFHYTSVQLLKINKNNDEEIIYGIRSLEYFFNDVFKNKDEYNKYNKYLYLLQDITYYFNDLIKDKLIDLEYFKPILNKINETQIKIKNKIKNNIQVYDIF